MWHTERVTHLCVTFTWESQHELWLKYGFCPHCPLCQDLFCITFTQASLSLSHHGLFLRRRCEIFPGKLWPTIPASTPLFACSSVSVTSPLFLYLYRRVSDMWFVIIPGLNYAWNNIHTIQIIFNPSAPTTSKGEFLLLTTFIRKNIQCSVLINRMLRRKSWIQTGWTRVNHD